jgi:hypothetical protein
VIFNQALLPAAAPTIRVEMMRTQPVPIQRPRGGGGMQERRVTRNDLLATSLGDYSGKSTLLQR